MVKLPKMSRDLEEIKDETANDFVDLCSVLKCELISDSDIKAEILERSLESDHNITDLVCVKLEEHDVYDSDVLIKEESFDPCNQSISEPDENYIKATHDIHSAIRDRNKDITHSNDEDSLYGGIFSTQIELTPTQTNNTAKISKTINSRIKRSAKKTNEELFSCGLSSNIFSSSKQFSHSHCNDLRKSEEKQKNYQHINHGCFNHTAKTQTNQKNRQTKFKTVAQMRETVNKLKMKHKSKQNDIKTKTTSSKRKILQCDECGQIFTFYNNLLRHQKKHSDGRVICDYCQKDYNRKSYLAEHIKVVHLKIARNNTVFMCAICNKTVRSVYALRCHMRIHTGKKPFSCDVCKKEFSNKWNLTVHCKSKKHNCSLKS